MGENKPESVGECPLCLDTYELDDLNFYPCPCEYQICRFCWHRIKNDENGLCPACRSPYLESPALYKPLTKEQLSTMKTEKKYKASERKSKLAENRKHLASVRVVQKCLVFVVGLSPRFTDSELLKKNDYFGKFGKIHKCVVNNNTNYAGSTGHSASAYITFYKTEDALRCVQQVNNIGLDGKTLKASLGTTKYCSQFLKAQTCNKPDCMYLHDLGEERASFTKEDMQQGKHQEYEQQLHDELFRREAAEAAAETSSDRYKTVFTLRSEASGQPPLKLGENDLASSQNSTNSDGFNHNCSASALQWGESSSSSSPIEVLETLDTDISDSQPIAQVVRTDHIVTTSPLQQEPPDRDPFFGDGKMNLAPSRESSVFSNDLYGDPAHRLLNGRHEETHSNHDPSAPSNGMISGFPGLDHLNNLQSTKLKDDDLEFDPFKECQKGLEELMQNELTQAKQNAYSDPFNVSSYSNTHSQFSPSLYQDQNFVSRGGDYQNNYDKKEWQEGLRALLPNVNISFQSQSVRSNEYPSQSPWHLSNWNAPVNQNITEDPAIISTRRTDSAALSSGYWENNNFLADGLPYSAMKQRYQNAPHLVNWNSETFTHNAPPPGFKSDMN